MSLFLVRHGRASAGLEAEDPPLDDLGRAQAEAAAGALRGSDAGRLIVSPLARTRETAAPVARALGLTPEIRDEVAEVVVGNVSAERRRVLIRRLLQSRWSEQDRALRAWRQRVLSTLVALGSERPTVVVSHFVAISAAIGEARNDDRVSCHPVANASITRVDVRDGKLVLLEAGSITHLDEAQITATHTALSGASSR